MTSPQTSARRRPSRPRPAPRRSAAWCWRRPRMEARLMLRNGEQLLLAVVVPVVVLVAAVTGSDRVDLDLDHPAVDVFTPGVLALAVMSTSFTSLAIATGFERRYGVIKRLGTSPLPRCGLLAGKVLALLIVQLAAARRDLRGGRSALGWSPDPGVAGVVGAAGDRRRHRGLRLARAAGRRARCAPRRPWPRPTWSTCCSWRAAPLCSPPRRTAASRALVQWLPSGALGEGMRDALIDGTIAVARDRRPPDLDSSRRRAQRAHLQVGVICS